MEKRVFFEKCSIFATIPNRATAKSAGLDLTSVEDYIIPINENCKISTGLKIKLPSATYGRIAARSGLALNHKIVVGGGVIDEDFRGEICVILFNFGDKAFIVKKGDRIAQLICELICYPEIFEVSKLDITERGNSGFGSS